MEDPFSKARLLPSNDQESKSQLTSFRKDESLEPIKPMIHPTSDSSIVRAFRQISVISVVADSPVHKLGSSRCKHCIARYRVLGSDIEGCKRGRRYIKGLAEGAWTIVSTTAAGDRCDIQTKADLNTASQEESVIPPRFKSNTTLPASKVR